MYDFVYNDSIGENMIFFFYYYCTCYADLHNLFLGKGLYWVDCYQSEKRNEV